MGVGEKTMIFRRQKERAAQLLWMIHKACIVVSLCFLLYITRERERLYLYITWIELYINMYAANPERVEMFPGDDLHSKALCVL